MTNRTWFLLAMTIVITVPLAIAGLGILLPDIVSPPKEVSYSDDFRPMKPSESPPNRGTPRMKIMTTTTNHGDLP